VEPPGFVLQRGILRIASKCRESRLQDYRGSAAVHAEAPRILWVLASSRERPSRFIDTQRVSPENNRQREQDDCDWQEFSRVTCCPASLPQGFRTAGEHVSSAHRNNRQATPGAIGPPIRDWLDFHRGVKKFPFSKLGIGATILNREQQL
jgi:hypothetical protein